MTLLGEIGTIEWCRRTNGILGRGERARFLAAVVLKTAGSMPRLLASRAGLRGGGPDPSQLTPPDTPFARDVIEVCAELDPMVVEHGYRSYLFGRALGLVEGVECDEEALFAATMLHDYAFMTMGSLNDKCFTLAGAEAAEQVLATAPLDESLRHERHPRHGFSVRGVPLLRAHGRRVRGCRAGALFLAGFGPALKTGPWRAADRASA